MKDSSLQPGESYENGTRNKYRDADVARNYHDEFTKLPLSPNRLMVWLVTRGELRAIRRACDLIQNQIRTIVDMPCGTGKLLATFQSYRFVPIAVDISEQMMSIAKQLNRGAGFIRADGTRLPMRSESVDAAVCLRLMHRLPADIKQQILDELKRVSRKFVIVSFGIDTRWQRLRRQMRQRLTGRVSVPYPVTQAQMLEMAQAGGWHIGFETSVVRFLSSQQIVLLGRPDKVRSLEAGHSQE